MNSYARLAAAFIIYMVSMVISLVAIPSILSQGYVVAYFRPYQLMAFADILVILGFLIAYLIAGAKTLLYVAVLALAALIPINYLDIYTRISQGVRITILPLLIRIDGPSGPSLSIDLGQVSALVLVAMLLRGAVKRGSPSEASRASQGVGG